MQVNIITKSIAKTRNVASVPYEVKDNLSTLSDLIENLVNIEITKYENNEIKALNQSEIDSMLEIGKVTFGFKYRESQIDRAQAVQVAFEAVQDGLVKVFINQTEIDSLDAQISLKPNDEISIVRLVMLSGRYY